MFKRERNIPRLVNLNSIKKGMRIQLQPNNQEEPNYYVVTSVGNQKLTYLDDGHEKTIRAIVGDIFWTLD